MASTRSKSKKLVSQCETDSGLIASGGCPASPSTENPYANPRARTIPTQGGRIEDHTDRTATTSQIPTSLSPNDNRDEMSAPSVTSRTSCVTRASRRAALEAARREAELEAARKVAQIKEDIVQKELAVKIAQLDVEAAQNEENLEDEDELLNENLQRAAPVEKQNNTCANIQEWLQKSPPPTARGARPAYDHKRPSRETEAEWPLNGTGPGEQKNEISQLAEAIGKLTRPRPVPKQAYELPTFTGNVSDWRAFKSSYEATTAAYEYKTFENLARLRVALQGKAKVAVAHLLAANSRPEEIMRNLEMKFGRPDLIIEDVLIQVKALPRVTDSGRELSDFAVAVRNCVAVLTDVDEDGYINNPQLVRDLMDKLTPYLRNKYAEHVLVERREGRRTSKLVMLADFLDHEAELATIYARVSATNNTAPIKTAYHRRAPRMTTAPHRVNTHVEQVIKCDKCNDNHKITSCEQFKSLNNNDKWNFVKEKHLCFKCLVKSHPRSYCRAKSCVKCHRGHHTLLHTEPRVNSAAPPPVASTAGTVANETVTNIGIASSHALLKVLPVTIQNGESEFETYALLDDDASISLLDTSVATAVNAVGRRSPLRIISARGHSVMDNDSRIVTVAVRGPNKVNHEIKCRTMSQLDLPTQSMSVSEIAQYKHLSPLQCDALDDAKPLLLLGQDNWELIIGYDLRRGKSGQPVATLTELGWVLHGRRHNRHVGNFESVNCIVDLHDIVKEHFDLESIGITPRTRKNKETERAENILNTTSKKIDGRWEIGLLWKDDNVEFPDNYSMAKNRLKSIERKMDAEPNFAEAYTAQINKLIDSGYAAKIKRRDIRGSYWFLPHFAVINPNKPGKVRVVFDAAARYDGKSLNDRLLSGPDLLNSLVGILFRFRIGAVAFTGDIQDMFLRVKLINVDQRAQLFLWRGADRTQEPEVYAMTSLIFGAASSPTSAIYILNKNAESFKDDYPEAVDIIKNSHYVDDCIHSSHSIDEATRLVQTVTHIHAQGGFVIRGWTTNSPELRTRIGQIDETVTAKINLDKGETRAERTLGLIWDPNADALRFDLSFKKLPSAIVNGTEVPTKRQFLAFIMSVFDPLGILCPYTIKAKILLQRVWASGVTWDQKLTERDFKSWIEWLDEIKSLTEVSVPRCYHINNCIVQLHVFGDASEKAYGAVAYWRITENDGSVRTALIAGKARVAPVKVVSVPRLELQAAVLACRLAHSIIKEHNNVNIEKRTFWTDSQTVLNWIRSDPRNYKAFVAHRLAEIDEKTSPDEWRWVDTINKPADDASRDSTCYHGNSDRWFHGPDFLKETEDRWPVQKLGRVNDSVDFERKVTTEITLTIKTQPDELIEATRFSSWTRLVRTMAHVDLFIKKLQKQQDGPLSASNTRAAEQNIHKEIQRLAFQPEIAALSEGTRLPKSSKLKSLDPMLHDGVLRVRGRIRAADLDFDRKHPIILDSKHHAVRLLIMYYHRRAGHANNEMVVNLLRKRYYILSIRPAVKSIAAACRLCRVRKSQPLPPKMGDLPAARLAAHQRPFTHCGVDYFGPMEVTVGRRHEKRWAALFTCLSTRAVHIELASSLSADSMIMALRRFMARRGRPVALYSDRGTNFVGADTELKRALEEINTAQQNNATTAGIDWRFVPPASPHMGGSWERLVRSVKVALKASLNSRAPKEEVLATLMAEAENIVNSRPLTHVSVDPADPVALTPNHFLLGSASGHPPPGAHDQSDLCSRKQWRTSQALTNMFWSRWVREYLPTLQQRHKWTNNVPPLKQGDVVIIVDNTLPRNTWPKGIIEEVYPGADGQVRVVKIKCKNGTLCRPAVKVIALPNDEELSP